MFNTPKMKYIGMLRQGMSGSEEFMGLKGQQHTYMGQIGSLVIAPKVGASSRVWTNDSVVKCIEVRDVSLFDFVRIGVEAGAP